MPKRFTDTEKWRDPWFRKLSPTAKLLFMYIVDNCNCIGLIDLDLEAAEFMIGCKIKDEHLKEIESRTQTTITGKIFMPKFIDFQYGMLSDTCPAHKPVFREIQNHGLVRDLIGYQYPKDRVAIGIQTPTGQDKDKDKDKKGDARGIEKSIIDHLNAESGSKFEYAESHLKEISARLEEINGDVDGMKKAISRQVKLWKDDLKMADYLRPSTLFRKSNFPNYYGLREVSLIAKTQPAQKQSNVPDYSKMTDKQIAQECAR